MPPLLSVIVPAYNESARLEKSLGTIIEYLEQHYVNSELIVVDDGSTDDTLRVVEQYLDRPNSISTRIVPIHPNCGKGHAVHMGMLAATSQIALFTDADLSTPMTETPKLVDPILKGEYDLTFGSRALDRSLIGVHQPWRREQGGRVFNLLVRWATGLPYWDSQCGFKAFRLSMCRPIIKAATIERFGFDVELLFVAHQAGLRLLEVPIRWDHNDGSKVSVVRDSMRMFNEVRAIRSQSRRGVYKDAIQESREHSSREQQEVRDVGNKSVTDEIEMKPDLTNATN